MNWLILSCVCALVSVAAGLLTRKFAYDDRPISVSAAYAVAAIACIVFFLLLAVSDRTEESVFAEQKKYIESHVSQTEIEDAALTSKKIELNAWLYTAQYIKSHYKRWSCYSDEILDWEPIQ